VARYQVTILWGQATMGASETYYTDDVSDTSAVQNINQMLKLRSQMLKVFQYFQGVRIATTTTLRRSQFMVPGPNFLFATNNTVVVPATGTIPSGEDIDNSDQFRAVMQIILNYDNNRKVTRYLSGIPDAIIRTEPATIDPNGNPTWWASYNVWQQYIVKNGWFIKAQKLPPTVPAFMVVGVTAQAAAPGLLGIQVDGTLSPAFKKGMKIAAQHFRPAKGTRAATLNGTWIIDSVDATGLPDFVTIYLRGSQGIDPTLQRITDKTFVRYVQYDYYRIQNIAWQRGGIHKRGKPSTAPRGRRLTRPTLDP